MQYFALLAPFISVALCLFPRLSKQAAPPVVNDGIILNYALTLEYFKEALYRYGLSMYGRQDFVSAGFPDPFYDNILQIYLEELTHITFWNGALWAAGIEPTVELEYTFPLIDPESFVTLAGIFEGVAVSAYLGMSPSVTDKDYLIASNSILSTSSRHSSYIRATLGTSPFPNSFDTPLSFNAVYSLARLFIQPSALANNPVQLPFHGFLTLTLTCSPYYYESDRSSVVFANAAQTLHIFGHTPSAPIFAVFFSGLQMLPTLTRTMAGNPDLFVDRIPAGISGQAYVFLSASDEDFEDDNVIAGPAILEVYPKGRIPEDASRKQC